MIKTFVTYDNHFLTIFKQFFNNFLILFRKVLKCCDINVDENFVITGIISALIARICLKSFKISFKTFYPIKTSLRNI